MDSPFTPYFGFLLSRTWLSEMSEGIKDKEEVKEEEEDGDDAINAEDLDRISVNPPVRRESKKTRTQRNKEKKKKMQVCWGI